MALADAAKAVVISLILRDLGDNQATKEFVVPTSVWAPATGLWADLKTIRDNLVTAYDAITDCLIYRAIVSIRQTEDTEVHGAALSEVENLASIVCNLSTAGKQTVIQVPAPNVGIMSGVNGKQFNIVDIADAALITFIDEYQLTGANFSLADGEFLDDTVPMDAGKRTHRGSRKG